jgi:hypothetical protein
VIPRLGDLSGAVADLGILVPLVTALVLVNGLDAGSVLLFAGLLVAFSGLVFGIPFPVQPLKALSAVAVAQGVAPEVIHAAGLEIGLFLLALSVRRFADIAARLFTHPVVRALQVGVGALLAVTAWRLVRDPPDVFRGTPSTPWLLVLAAVAFAGVVWAARRRKYGASLGGALSLHLPSFDVPSWGAMATAFLLLVVPQLPLTFGNAVVATSDLATEYFGPRASRVTPSRVCLSAGFGNVVASIGGGMPMCHGAGGLTAHYRLGARTATMNVVLGAVFVSFGLFFAPQIPAILGTLPAWVLAAFLAYAGLRHALLVSDLSGFSLGLAVVAGALGAWTGNLAITAGVAIAGDHGGRAVMRVRKRRHTA